MKQVMRESLLIKLPVIIGDLFLLNLSWILALTLYPQPACIARSLEILACLNICFIPGLSWFGVILSSRIVPYEEIIRRVFYVVLCHLGFFVLIQTVWSYGLLPVHLMGTFYIVLTVLLMLWRYTCRIVVKVTRGHGRNARRVIIVGSKDNAQEVYHEMVDNTSTGYRVLGYFSNHDDHTLPDNTPCLGSVDEALPWLEAHPVNEVYCCLSTDRYAEEIFPIMDFCENNFVRFFYVPNLRNYMKRTMNLELLGNVPILYIREEPLRQASNRFIKRAFDVSVSSLFLCTLFPFIYIFVAIGTKLTSRGPVLFLQERSGENGQTFRCIKFRSMRVNADADRVQATRDDPRKTRFGDFLRRSSIDEPAPVHQRAQGRHVHRGAAAAHAPAHRAILETHQQIYGSPPDQTRHHGMGPGDGIPRRDPLPEPDGRPRTPRHLVPGKLVAAARHPHHLHDGMECPAAG